MIRMALLSDIHGNSIALEAVLSDIQSRGGVDAYWLLGDLAAIGYDPVNTLFRLRGLPDATFVQGNTERYLVTGERPGPALEEASTDPVLGATVLMIAESFAWTTGAVTSAGLLPWLVELPLEESLVLPDGTRMLGVHVAPGQDDGRGIHPALDEDGLRAVVAGCGADLVFAGHTHWPLEVSIDGVHVVNLGSVSNPFPPDLRASYVLLTADEQGYRVEHRRVAYDHQAVIDAAEEAQHPAASYIVRFQQGQNHPGWEHAGSIMEPEE